jgi:DNA-binding response OmpR family regulator
LSALILVVEDEPGIVDFIDRGLKAHGFDVISAMDGVTGTELALSANVALIVLDLMLPGRGGLELLTAVQAVKPGLPTIILTARGEINQRVAGLDAGAVDYLTKPFALSELAARIRAQLRVVAQTPITTIGASDIEVNLLTREVLRSGEPVRLSATEFDLLVYLMHNSGSVLSREKILRVVWGYDYDPGTNVVDVYIGYLRRKLRRVDGSTPIVTVRSVGYRFDASD